MQFLFFYTPKLRSQVWTFIIENYWQTLFRTSLFTEFLFSLQLEIVQCPYENRNRGRLLSASARVGVFKGRFILDYEQKMQTSLRVMETNPPGANRPLTNLAQSYSYSVKANSATLLFWVISNFKSKTMMVVKVHETFDFLEIESDTIFHFCFKVPKKTVVLIWICYQAIFFSEKVGGRLQNKTVRRTGWSQVKPED